MTTGYDDEIVERKHIDLDGPEERKYDPITCITAGELRAMGVTVGETIPDCGWVRRDKIVPGPIKVTGQEGDWVQASMGLHFTEGFYWVEATILLDKPLDFVNIKLDLGDPKEPV